MKIILAPDKFRGSLEAGEVCAAMYDGIKEAFPKADIITFPLADGGEGTMDILTQNAQGIFKEVEVCDPLGKSIRARYGLAGNGEVAFIEMAEASGLRLLDPSEYNPLLTSTYGTGELIRHALESGVREIILALEEVLPMTEAWAWQPHWAINFWIKMERFCQPMERR